MGEAIRTFIAVEVAERVRREAAALMAAIPAPGVKISRVPEENLHLTLKFLGDIAPDQVVAVSAAADRIARGHRPFRVGFCGLGAFPSSARPGTLWVGVGEGSPSLMQLAADLESALAGLGFPRERRRFHPHLTLGRVRRGRGDAIRALGEAIGVQAAADLGTSLVEQLVVFASYLNPGGARYEAMSRMALGTAGMSPGTP